MNKAVTLMTEWGAFDEKHPDGSLEDFCRYYLSQAGKSSGTKEKSALIPDNIDSQLMRLMGRIMLVHGNYADKALIDTGVNRVEEFTMLNAVLQLKNPRKIEVIQECLHEVSTGTDILKRLLKAGYLNEKDDQEDKRSKRLSVTAKGEKVALKARKQISSLAKRLLSGLDDNDKKLCIQLLTRVEKKLSEEFSTSRGKTFGELLASGLSENRM